MRWNSSSIPKLHRCTYYLYQFNQVLWHHMVSLDNNELMFYEPNSCITEHLPAREICSFMIKCSGRYISMTQYMMSSRFQMLQSFEWSSPVKLSRRHEGHILSVGKTNWKGMIISCHGNVFPSHIAKCMGPTWGPPGSCRPQMGPMLAHEPCYQGFLWMRIPSQRTSSAQHSCVDCYLFKQTL